MKTSRHNLKISCEEAQKKISKNILTIKESLLLNHPLAVDHKYIFFSTDFFFILTFRRMFFSNHRENLEMKLSSIKQRVCEFSGSIRFVYIID